MTSKSNHTTRVLLVGFTVPDQVVEQICSVDRFMPIQTHKFSWSIVRGLEANGVLVDLLSAAPVGSYPNNPQIFFTHKKWQRGNSSWNIMMPFVNLLVVKHITRFVACLFLTAAWLLQTRHETRRLILLHGVHSPFMYAVLLMRKIFSFKAVTIVSDPPGVALAGENFITTLLRKIDTGIISNALRSMNGLVVLTKQLSLCFAPLVPAIVVEGILYADDYRETECCHSDYGVSSDSCFSILYAGGLQAEYGVELLLEAFALTHDPSFRLWIMGKGDLTDKIKTAAQTDSRIVFNGYCPQHELKERMREATVLINPRPANQPFTQFSFPSKTIEYLASGRPVITTRLPGIPEEYFQHVFTLEKETPEELSALFIRLNAMPDMVLTNFGAGAKNFVLNNKNETSQGQKIATFIQRLTP